MPTLTATHTVTRIRTEPAATPSGVPHRHISEVLADDVAYPLADVLAGLERGETWQTEGPDGTRAAIRQVHFCTFGTCKTAPYITTSPKDTDDNKLQNLPEF